MNPFAGPCAPLLEQEQNLIAFIDLMNKRMACDEAYVTSLEQYAKHFPACKPYFDDEHLSKAITQIHNTLELEIAQRKQVTANLKAELASLKQSLSEWLPYIKAEERAISKEREKCKLAEEMVIQDYRRVGTSIQLSIQSFKQSQNKPNRAVVKPEDDDYNRAILNTFVYRHKVKEANHKTDDLKRVLLGHDLITNYQGLIAGTKKVVYVLANQYHTLGDFLIKSFSTLTSSAHNISTLGPAQGLRQTLEGHIEMPEQRKWFSMALPLNPCLVLLNKPPIPITRPFYSFWTSDAVKPYSPGEYQVFENLVKTVAGTSEAVAKWNLLQFVSWLEADAGYDLGACLFGQIRLNRGFDYYARIYLRRVEQHPLVGEWLAKQDYTPDKVSEFMNQHWATLENIGASVLKENKTTDVENALIDMYWMGPGIGYLVALLAYYSQTGREKNKKLSKERMIFIILLLRLHDYHHDVKATQVVYNSPRAKLIKEVVSIHEVSKRMHEAYSVRIR